MNTREIVNVVMLKSDVPEAVSAIYDMRYIADFAMLLRGSNVMTLVLEAGNAPEALGEEQRWEVRDMESISLVLELPMPAFIRVRLVRTQPESYGTLFIRFKTMLIENTREYGLCALQY